MPSDELKVVTLKIVAERNGTTLESLLEELIDLMTSKMHTINRRLTGSVSLDAHDAKSIALLRRCGVADGVVQKLISKAAIFSQDCYQICSVDRDARRARFDTVCIDEGKNPHVPFAYTLQLCDAGERDTLSISYDAKENGSWLENSLGPAVLRWIENILSNTLNRNRQRLCEGTNNLIGVEEYSKKYREIKDQMGREIAKNWIDSTSAEKFVFEDCGIAAYLSVLWKARNVRPMNFVDIGCGNGLLVHLLNRLEFSGCGIDLRERKTWKGMFPGGTVNLEYVEDALFSEAFASAADALLERVVDPSSSSTSLPEGTDYIIGNHSDELTPWIPVMAARLSLPFFLLPCCPFDFYGKLPRTGKGSLYEELILYAKSISERLGYIVEVDKLAIPSTKRTALICTVPAGGLRKDLHEEIERLLEESKKGRVFTARAKEEKVRNCSSIDKNVREDLIARVVKKLLENSEDAVGWRAGGSLPLADIVCLLSKDERRLMKEQCGGVQTFLRNQHQVFKVISGAVRLRDWRRETRSVPSEQAKRSPCWFHSHHPDGCPLGDECTFIH